MLDGLQGISIRLVAEGKTDERRRFWLPYVESNVPMLWYPAQQALGRPIPKNYDFYDEFTKWRRDNDPDPTARKEADLYLRRKQIRSRADPETGRLSPEDLAELQQLDAEDDD